MSRPGGTSKLATTVHYNGVTNLAREGLRLAMIVAMIWRAVSTDVQVRERKGRPARCLAGRQRGAVRPMLGTTAQLSRGAADSGARENARAVVARGRRTPRALAENLGELNVRMCSGARNAPRLSGKALHVWAGGASECGTAVLVRLPRVVGRVGDARLGPRARCPPPWRSGSRR